MAQSFFAKLTAPGSWFHLVKGGARMHPVECLLAGVLPLALFMSDATRALCLTNAKLQVCLFLPVVILPALLRQRISYVDIGWPCGLVVLALVVLLQGDGYWGRRGLAGGCLLLHGGRMALGSLVMFFPYSFKEDLPRYQYAKVRFESQDGMSPSLWWIKIQHDIMQQCGANFTVLAAPFMLMAVDSHPGLRPLEVAGGLIWILAWIFESVADVQMIKFRQRCPEDQRETAVLGRAPFDTSEYCLWTLCRHPNYFGEWMCWNGFVIMAVPSLLALNESLPIRLAFGGMLLFLSRALYDCLAYWTGAEPAEYFSSRKRAEYRQHQETTRMFFPFEVPFVEHHRVSGWPVPQGKES